MRSVDIRFEELDPLLNRLERLEIAIGGAITRRATLAGATVGARAVNVAAPKRTGLMGQSFGADTRKGKDTPYGIFGPRRSVTGSITTYGRGSARARALGVGGKAHRIVPANYAHLVEFGHVILSRPAIVEMNALKAGAKTARLAGNKALYRALAVKAREVKAAGVIGNVQPHPFARPAVMGAKGAIVEAMRAEYARGIQAEVGV